MDSNISHVDQANLSPLAAARLLASDFPPLPIIPSLNWSPPAQTPPVVQSSTPDRIRIWANADSHDWTEMMIDTPGGDGAAQRDLHRALRAVVHRSAPGPRWP